DIPNAVVVIRGRRIESVGAQKRTVLPRDAQIIDVTGKYIVPGLNDVFAGLNSQAQANAYLFMGVTAIVGSDEPGGRRGALMTTANPIPRIYPLALVDRPEDVETAARKGAKVLLLYYHVAPADMPGIVRHAHELGLATIGELGETKYSEAID